jgi:hypothetical protein
MHKSNRTINFTHQISDPSDPSDPFWIAALMYWIIRTRDCSLATRCVPRSGPLACQPNFTHSHHGTMQMVHDSMSTLRPDWSFLKAFVDQERAEKLSIDT